ncbi:hypothetical protein LL037_20850 [Clostridium estertheticum]|uniref:Uncharacterized protein n=1 Tax=Clostridium estertheticum TaxID=238834 RepID=A0AA47EIQ7_9CLOT|nr:hypothetical protein [Clostridium estertheticum]MBU3153558.1 hypothetical protein [Clostridium estertheticum]MBU3200652.1 hypothetical protein [Clostridium estertheticum]WAG60957.1 hypothetical protein LL038_01525 [Clostridium estertheticum]WAG64888.1 hypothetical protein LL037_20850 [Clostridium estertheticum]
MWCWWLVLLLLVEDDGFDGNNCRNNRCGNNNCGCTNNIIINRNKKCHKKNRNLCSNQD